MQIKKNKKAFALPIILVIIGIIATSGGYVVLKNNFQNKNTKNEDLIVKNNTQEEQKQESENQKQKIENKEEKKENTTEIEQKNENQEKNQEKETKQNTFVKQNKQKETINNQEKNEEKKSNEIKKTNYVDQPRQGGFIYIDNELQLSVFKEENGIRLIWTRCNSDQFVAYKIARSESASDVYYPRDGSIASIPNQDSLAYFDTNVEKGKTYYYRICSFEKNGESWCGNVVSVNF